MNIMVTGAAGGYGTYALEYLKKYAPNDAIIAQVRDKAKAKALEKQGYEVRAADYADAAAKHTGAAEGTLPAAVSRDSGARQDHPPPDQHRVAATGTAVV